MQPRIPSSFDANPPADPPPAPPFATDTDADDFDSFIGLINQCVDAMNIMQERMSGLEDHARRTGETLARDKVETRADLSTLRTRIKLAESSVDQMAIRLSACEASTIEITATHAREYATARTDAESWRKRAESDLARLTGFENRLVSVESGLERRLERTEAELADASTEVTALRSRAEQGEVLAFETEQKLADATLAIADQRARIACLQAKLSAATDVMRFSDQSAAVGERAVPGAEGGIIDLATLTDDRRTSAA